MARQSQARGHPPGTTTILLTRPEPGASATAAALRRQLGEVAILLSPLMAVEFLTPWLPLRAFSAVIFTSRAGVASAVRLREAGAILPQCAYAVGDGTAAAALVAGFQTRSAQGDALALVGLIRSDSPTGPLLHLRGREAGGALAKGLQSAGLETFEAVTYAQVARPLTDQARHLLQAETRVILPLFSPRSALLFHRATTELARLAPLDIVAMSAAVALAAAPIPAQHRIIAAEPTEAAMVWSVLTRLRQNPDLKETGSAR